MTTSSLCCEQIDRRLSAPCYGIRYLQPTDEPLAYALG